jgi:small-conductance mechanosensitive channel
MKKIALFFLVLLFSAQLLADANQPFPSFFATKKAADQLNRMEKKLSSRGIVLQEALREVDKLELFQDEAENCVAKSREELVSLGEILKPSYLSKKYFMQQPEYRYIQEKKRFYTKHYSECRFFAYQSKELLRKYKVSIQELNTRNVLRLSTPVWEIKKSDIMASVRQLKAQKIMKVDNLSLSIFSIIVTILSLTIALFVALFVRSCCCKIMQKNSSLYPAFLSLVLIIRSFVIPLFILGALGLLVDVFIINKTVADLIYFPVYAPLYLVLLIALSKYLFMPLLNKKNTVNVSPMIGRRLYSLSVAMIVWGFIGYCLGSMFQKSGLNIQFVDFSRAIYISIFSIIGIWNIILFKARYFSGNNDKPMVQLVNIILALLFLGLALIVWFGFHGLTIFIVRGLALTLGSLLVTATVWVLINSLYNSISNSDGKARKQAASLFGVSVHRSFKEVFLLKLSCYVVFLASLILYLMGVWGVSTNVVDKAFLALTDGFNIAGIRIVPLRIVIALVVFSVVLLIGRFIAQSMARKERFNGEQDAQVAVKSILVYVFFAVALLIALFIVQVNFTGLAIIAGALSIGVGLGLQNIVNNFVSGVILLLEKPIKPGDRVIVGETEGFVKKIRLRATQITTLSKEDVIIPNAELISTQVTNYMFRDNLWRVVCPVGVAYGSDIDLVKTVLLDIASGNSSVIQEPPSEPIVLFKAFGDSSLQFELWCIIPDVNKKFRVLSELNYAIDNAFKQHGITIAFPQRDVHIKNSGRH